MKYKRLTKEQFESLHQEFAIFLASQSIDVKEWDEIKTQKPEVALEEMKVFSDIVWEDVLTKTTYLDANTSCEPRGTNAVWGASSAWQRRVSQKNKERNLQLPRSRRRPCRDD